MRMTVQIRQLATTRPISKPRSRQAAALVGRDRRAIEPRGRDPRRRARAATPRARIHARFDAFAVDSMAALEVGQARTAGRARRSARRAARGARRRRRSVCALPRAPAGLRASWSLPRCRRHAARPEGHAARPRRHLRAGRQGGLSVERADERDPGPGGGRRRDRHGGAHAARRAQPAGAGRRAWPASTACSRSAARRPSARSPTAPRPSPRSTRSPARATPTSPAPSGACSARSAST
jgi:hypothetical protein